MEFTRVFQDIAVGVMAGGGVPKKLADRILEAFEIPNVR
jgi:hypothetical protein